MSNRGIEYQMTKKMFDSILETRTEAEKKQNPFQFVMAVVNEQYGLRGTVKRLAIYGN